MNAEREKINLVSEKDLRFSYFCGSGAGGQARNKVHSGVQCHHEESGAIGRASDTRSQADNKRAAFLRMTQTAQFKFWVAKRKYEIDHQESLEASVERETVNMHYEIKNAAGQWEEVPSEYFETDAAKAS